MSPAPSPQLPPLPSNLPDAPPSARKWENRRSTLRHDELKNRFLDRLDTFIDNDLAETDPELRWLTVFIEDDLSRWAEHSGEAQILIDTYSTLLTPRTLLDNPPLNAFDQDDERWLGEVVHALWQVRCTVESDRRQAQNALNKVNSIYQTLASDLETVDTVADLKRMRPTFESFQEAGYELVDALGNFCREVKVT